MSRSALLCSLVMILVPLASGAAPTTPPMPGRPLDPRLQRLGAGNRLPNGVRPAPNKGPAAAPHEAAAAGPIAPHEGICGEDPDEAKPEGERSVSDAVFTHVSNESEVELENPFTGTPFFFAKLPQCKRAFNIPWLDLSLSKHLIWLWFGSLVLILLMTVAKPTTMTPRGLPLALEMLVVFVRDELAKNNIPKHEYRRYTPYLLSCFFFILTMNLMGILPYTATPTGNVMVTAALAICTFVLTQVAAIRAAGVGGYLKHLTGGTPPAMWIVMIPVEILGLFTKPFALAVRLFANMIAGHIVIFFLLGLIIIFKSPYVGIVAVPFAAAVYLLEIFVAFLQAYVFTMLSSVFIGMAVASGHHDDHGAHAEGHSPAAH